ncbi:2-dehydro-3-deoxygluconokinase [Palleronia aestuarii]|uniref:2-dehydro-3-deoxygluconokinase n=1 Tax=Palleronia aestuarii TaxID=568105 RepID=A0A2W7NFX0_9RHOB|nr:sugar kinase [Palleronia aestuarii]PZX18810.1 2-dehydro-3-deoxygluconokinase [Palleronia aestuarii]
MAARFVSIGECMVEMAPAEMDGTFRMGFAGDTCNTAFYLRQLLPNDWDVDYVTAIGCDRLSNGLRDFLDGCGIGTSSIMRRDDRTLGLYLIELQDGERSFAYWRSSSAARTLAEDRQALMDALAGADIVYFSGITLGILDASSRATLLDCADEARSNGARIVFDSNLRPALWPDAEAMCAAVSAAAGHSDIVLPSFDDEARFFGDADPEATAGRYADAGASLVVVKNGEAEIVVREGDAVTRYPSVPAEKIVDTTAAGDSFNAGFLAAHLTGADLGAAVARGAELAARVIARRGAMVDLA